MLDLAERGQLDFLKLDDDYPVLFTADLYRVGAVRDVLASGSEAIEAVHLNYQKIADDTFSTGWHKGLRLSDDVLQQARKDASTIYFIPRMDVEDKVSGVGDHLTRQYEIEREHVRPVDRLPAVAGAIMTGGDISPEIVAKVTRRVAGIAAVTFRVADITNLISATISLTWSCPQRPSNMWAITPACLKSAGC